MFRIMSMGPVFGAGDLHRTGAPDSDAADLKSRLPLPPLALALLC